MTETTTFIAETMVEAGKSLSVHFGSQLQIRKKSDRSLVTNADLESERVIVNALKKAYPKDFLLSEESRCYNPLPNKDKRKPGTFVWVVDPLDGTTNYIHQYPLFCVSIARGVIEQDKTIKVLNGGIYAPSSKNMFSAQLNEGAFLNIGGGTAERCHVSRTSALEDAFVSVGFYHGDSLTENLHGFADLVKRFKSVRKDGSTALDLAHVSAGIFDGFLESTIKPWDLAAGSLLIKEAGGAVESFSGTSEFHIESGDVVAGSKELVHNLRKEFFRNS